MFHLGPPRHERRGYQHILPPGKGHVHGLWGVGRAVMVGTGACTATIAGVINTKIDCAVPINRVPLHIYVRSSTIAPPASQPTRTLCFFPPPLTVVHLPTPNNLIDELQKLMSADETDRLQALRAEGRDLDQFWVSPRLGRLSSRASMIVLAPLVKASRVDYTTLA